jgi:hypothetical protein
MNVLTALTLAERESRRYHALHGAPVGDSNSKLELDRRLDQALEDTFPASDPVSIVICVKNG